MNETTARQFHAQFQTFDDPPEAAQAAPRVAALRAELARRGLDGFVVPHADRHQNEYLAPSEERLAWLTGFTGSAGMAMVRSAGSTAGVAAGSGMGPPAVRCTTPYLVGREGFQYFTAGFWS